MLVQRLERPRRIKNEVFEQTRRACRQLRGARGGCKTLGVSHQNLTEKLRHAEYIPDGAAEAAPAVAALVTPLSPRFTKPSEPQWEQAVSDVQLLPPPI